MNVPPPAAAPRRQLTVLDTTSIIVGIIIGAGIFEATPVVAANVPGPMALLGIWLAGGLVALVGALCYAELTTTYPRSGGDYVFLTRAYGRGTGFLFAWAEYWIVRPGNVGAMAYVFARYAHQLWPLGTSGHDFVIYACAAVGLLTGLNLLGVRFGKWTQNGLTCAKLAGLLAVIGVGLLLTRPEPMAAGALSEPAPAGWSLALIMVLFAYGGWNEMSYVAAEIREPEQNVLRALLLGSLTVSTVYLLVNVAFLRTLGFEGLRTSPAVAAAVVRLRFADWGEGAISLLICVSCLGAINGMLFTGARIYYAMGTEHPLFRWLGNWSGRVEAPTHALVLQAVVTLALVVGFGPDQRAFERLVIFTTPVFWCFFLLVGISLFVLRARDPATPRVFRVIAYPWTPLAFCLACLFMLQASLAWAVHNRSREVLWSVGILLTGAVVYLGDLLLRHRRRLRG